MVPVLWGEPLHLAAGMAAFVFVGWLAWLRYRVGYSPFEGTPLHGWPATTVVRGRVVYRDHAVVGTPQGRPIQLG